MGDHGGGPTRQDLDRIEELSTWPLFPRLTFSTLRKYFDSICSLKEQLPVLQDEINFICDGCYTTQARIKAGNRKAERLLKDSEFYGVAANIRSGKSYPHKNLHSAWVRTLFNQFHDILPGSCVTETREHASGIYQEAFAAAETAKKLSLSSIVDRINTATLVSEMHEIHGTRGEGAGVGHTLNATTNGDINTLMQIIALFTALVSKSDDETAIEVLRVLYSNNGLSFPEEINMLCRNPNARKSFLTSFILDFREILLDEIHEIPDCKLTELYGRL